MIELDIDILIGIAESGDSDAQCALVLRYHYGHEVDRNINAAIDLLLKAERLSNAEVEYQLAIINIWLMGSHASYIMGMARLSSAASKGHKVSRTTWESEMARRFGKTDA